MRKGMEKNWCSKRSSTISGTMSQKNVSLDVRRDGKFKIHPGGNTQATPLTAGDTTDDTASDTTGEVLGLKHDSGV